MKLKFETTVIVMNKQELENVLTPKQFLCQVLVLFFPYAKYSPSDILKDNYVKAYEISILYAKMLSKEKEYYVGKRMRELASDFVNHGKDFVTKIKRMNYRRVLERMRDDILSGEGLMLHERAISKFPILGEVVSGFMFTTWNSRKERKALKMLFTSWTSKKKRKLEGL